MNWDKFAFTFILTTGTMIFLSHSRPVLGHCLERSCYTFLKTPSKSLFLTTDAGNTLHQIQRRLTVCEYSTTHEDRINILNVAIPFLFSASK
jgi:hypothetical protein